MSNQYLFEKDNKIHAPEIRKEKIVKAPETLFIILIKMDGKESPLTTIIHGSKEHYVEMFTSKEKGKIFWSQLAPKLTNVEFVTFHCLENASVINQFLSVLTASKVQHRVDPYQSAVDSEGREVWSWRIFNL